MKRNIVIEKGKLLVKEFEMSGGQIVDYFETIEPEACEKGFEGAIKMVGIREKIDYIEKKIESLNQSFTNTLDSTVDDLDDKYEEMFGDRQVRRNNKTAEGCRQD